MFGRLTASFAAGLAAAALAWQPASAQSLDELYAKAKEEGELTWYTSHAAAEVMEAGERIAHSNSLRLNNGDCSRFARAYRMRASRFHANLAVAPLPLLLGVPDLS